MPKMQYEFTSHVAYGAVDDKMTMKTGQDVHLAALIQIAKNYDRLDEATKFDFHKIAVSLGFASAEQLIFSIHAIGHLYASILTTGVDIVDGLNERLGPVIEKVGNSFRTGGDGGQPAWSNFHETLSVGVAATIRSMNGESLSCQPTLDHTSLN